MKKILLSVVAVAAIAIGYQKYNQSQSMSDLMLANVEALANNESSSTYKYVVEGSDPSVGCVCSGQGSLSCC